MGADDAEGASSALPSASPARQIFVSGIAELPDDLFRTAQRAFRRIS